MYRAENVALYAVLLREAARNRHTNAEAHLDDMECQPGELSMATLLASQQFTELDWYLAEKLYDADGPTVVRTAQSLREDGEPLLAEALLHAYGKNGRRARAAWAEPFRDRWDEVRAAIQKFEDERIAAPFGELALDAERAAVGAGGMTYEELDEQFPSEPWDAYLYA